jgi:hypothetical protein
LLSTSAKQVTDFVKAAQGTTESVDGTTTIGGTAGKIGLDVAAYVFTVLFLAVEN